MQKSVLDEPAVATMLKSISHKENIKNPEISIDKGADKGDGYLSQMSMVKITSANSKDGNKLNLVIKCAQRDAVQRTTFPTHQLYLREIRFYEKVMPAFVKFQSDRHVKEPFCAVPKYYDSCVDENKEFLIMENIRVNGFELSDRKLPMDDEHAFMVLKSYAKMHAISFAMAEQDSKLYAELSDGLDNLFVPKYVDKAFFESFNLALDKAITLFNVDNVKEQKYVDKLKNYKKEYMDFFIMVGKSQWEHSVITHGDSWLNNIMFKYNQQNNKKQLVDLKLFDFQIMRKVSPILDIGYLIYMNTDASLYNDYERCLKYYYKHLTAHGKALGSDIDKVYSYETLKLEWAKYGQYGLLFGLLGVGILLQDKKDIVDLSDLASGKITAANVFFVENNTDEGIRRMRNLVIHFVDNNFI